LALVAIDLTCKLANLGQKIFIFGHGDLLELS
jgi:hypothetical protein